MSEKPRHFYRQSAVIPYRIRRGRLEVLLITSRKRKRWILPKGICEPNLSPAESAAKEALEEAGVEGRTSESIVGTYEYEKWGGTCTVQVFAMCVEILHDEWLESHRLRAWLSPTEAAERVEETALRELLRGFETDLGPR